MGFGAFIATDLERNEDLDFLVSPYPVEFRLISTRPKLESPYLNLLKPFDSLTWMCLLLSLGLVMLAFIWFTFYLSSQRTWLNLLKSSLHPYRILVDQGKVIV